MMKVVKGKYLIWQCRKLLYLLGVLHIIYSHNHVHIFKGLKNLYFSYIIYIKIFVQLISEKVYGNFRPKLQLKALACRNLQVNDNQPSRYSTNGTHDLKVLKGLELFLLYFTFHFSFRNLIILKTSCIKLLKFECAVVNQLSYLAFPGLHLMQPNSLESL